MCNETPQIALILAAGKGTRMGSNTIPKVCFPVEGTPAIFECNPIAGAGVLKIKE